MALNALFDGLDNVVSAGRFFVALTERLGDGTLTADEDAIRLSRVLGVPLPPELAGASIVSLDKCKADEREAVARAELAPTRIVITYPDIVHPGSGQTEKKFKKCFNVCQTVGGVKICAEVCVDISIGFSGISGKISATVSVSF